MKKRLFSIVVMGLILAACAPAASRWSNDRGTAARSAIHGQIVRSSSLRSYGYAPRTTGQSGSRLLPLAFVPQWGTGS